MKVRPLADGLNIEDILVCSHPDCEFSVIVKNNKARKSNMGGPVFCVCGAVMVPEEAQGAPSEGKKTQ